MASFYNRLFTMFALTLVIAGSLSAQSWVWTRGGSSNDGIYSANPLGIATDSHGNVYVTGYYGGTFTAGSTSVTSRGQGDIYLCKYDANGVIQWTKSFGSSKYSDGATALAIDASDNIFMGANVGDSLVINGTAYTVTGTIKAALIKFDPSGNYLWSLMKGGEVHSIIPDNSGGAFVAGKQDWFAVKVNSSGTATWAHSNGEYGFVVGTSAGIDDAGNYTILGAMQSSATFGSTTLTTTGLFDIDMLLVKYDKDGNVLWVKKPGAAGTNNESAREIAVLGNGDFYFVGSAYGKTGFGADTINAGTDIIPFVVKYSASGTPAWELGFTKMAGAFGVGNMRNVKIDKSGDVIVTGWAAGNFKFGPDTVKSNQLFVGRVGSDGTPKYAKSTSYTGLFNVVIPVAATLDGSGNLYITGTTQGSTIFNHDTVGNLTLVNAFTGKFAATPTGVTRTGDNLPGSFALNQNYPNPFNPTTNITFTVSRQGQVSLKVFDVLGREVAEVANGTFAPGSYTAVFDASALASGAYFAALSADGHVQTKSMLLVR